MTADQESPRGGVASTHGDELAELDRRFEGVEGERKTERRLAEQAHWMTGNP